MVNDRYVEHRQVGEYLQVIVDGEGRSVGTARTYAGRFALYLTWSTGDRALLSDRRAAGVLCPLARAHAVSQALPGPEPVTSSRPEPFQPRGVALTDNRGRQLGRGGGVRPLRHFEMVGRAASC